MRISLSYRLSRGRADVAVILSYIPLRNRHKTRFAHSQTQIQVGASGGTLEERRRWGGPLCNTAVQTCSIWTPAALHLLRGCRLAASKASARVWSNGSLASSRRIGPVAQICAPRHSRGRLHGRRLAVQMRIPPQGRPLHLV